MPLRRLLSVLAICMPHAADARGPVVLSTLDGSLTVEGELLSYDGEFFRVATAFGELTMDGGNLRCSGAGCPDPVELVARARIGGPSDMIHRLMPALLEVFADLNGLGYVRRYHGDDNVSWELTDPASGRLMAVFEGQVESDENALVLLASRELDISIGRSEARDDIRQDVIALDALVPVVAPENPRVLVTLGQLGGLLSGRIATWQRLGGADLPVALHLPEKMGPAASRLTPRGGFAEATRHPEPSDLADAVAADPAALGLVPYSALGNTTPLVVSGACGLATPATRDSIRAEDYPFIQPMFLQRIGARQPKLIRDFLGFARSPEAQPVIRATGFVDQEIGRIGFERQGDRIAAAVLSAGDDPAAMTAVRDLIAALMRAERLTFTFRFRDGESTLDPHSASNVLWLADAIGRGEFDGRELVFVGFSDGVGEADANLRLSERRARSVRRAVAARVVGEPVTLAVEAFGEIMPVACDDTPWGGQINRRVEVWLR
jgi:phosphate transport system substrate-binding protein